MKIQNIVRVSVLNQVDAANYVRMLMLLLLMLVLPTNTVLAGASIRYKVMSMGQVSTLSVNNVTRVAVGDDETLQVSLLDDGSAIVTPLKAGSSDLLFWNDKKIVQRYHYTVLPHDMVRQQALMESILRNYDDISVRVAGDKVIIEGEAPSDELETLTAAISTIPNAVSLVKPSFDVKDMIEMDVQFLEIDKRYGENIGINWSDSAHGPAAGLVKAIYPNSAYRLNPTSGVDGFGDGLDLIPVDTFKSYGYIGITTSLTSIINLMKQNNAGRVLSSPKLSARSGEAASFLAGGSIPYSTVNQFGQTSVEFQEYGIQLEIQPTSDKHGNILSQISAEVSSIDEAVSINGVPGLLIRNTETTVNLQSGQTYAISGLLKAEDSTTLDKVPVLGDLPVIGALFRSKAFQERRTELVILVTPRIKNPHSGPAIRDDLNQHRTALEGLMGGTSAFDKELVD